jgi:protein ImuA
MVQPPLDGRVQAANRLIPLLRARASGAVGAADIWHADDLVSATAAESASSGFDQLDQQLPGSGWPQGQLIELLHNDPGIGELSLLAPALAERTRAGRACVWVLPCERWPGADALSHRALPYPPALIEAGMDLSCSIFVKPASAREAWWSIEQSLRAAHLGALVGWLPTFSTGPDFRALRRLHLLAQRYRALLFVIRPSHCADTASPAVLRLRLGSDGELLTVALLKRRGRPLLEPVVLKVHPGRWNRRTVESAPATSPVATASPPLAQQPSAALGGPMRTILNWAQRANPARSEKSDSDCLRQSIDGIALAGPDRRLGDGRLSFR